MLEYVASGCSFFKLMYPELRTGEGLEFFEKTLGTLQDKHGHKVSLLYNAHTEKNSGKVFKPTFKGKGIYEVYADSGGLQMVTIGANITGAMKDKVYENQAQYSDVAMCFDEIPVAYGGGRSERLNLGNRWFDKDKFEFCARETGRNIKRQIEIFDATKSDARPIFIMQGNDYDTYMKWCEYAIDEVPEEMRDRIGGIAMGAAALGHGTLQDIQRAFYYTQLPWQPKNRHMHLLAVGSVTRLIPNIMFIQNGLYKDVWLSYDSTTHTSGSVMGRYYKDDATYVFDRVFNDRYAEIHADIKQIFPHFDVDLKLFYDAMNKPTRKHGEAIGNVHPLIYTYVAFVSAAIYNFTAHVEKVIKSEEAALNMFKYGSVEQNAFRALKEVKTASDFAHWEKFVGSSLDSTPVKSYGTHSLEDLFV